MEKQLEKLREIRDNVTRIDSSRAYSPPDARPISLVLDFGHRVQNRARMGLLERWPVDSLEKIRR